MTTRFVSIALALSAFALSAVPAAEQARITREVAERMALQKVPNGKIQEGELERERGQLVWSFDISQPDSKNITEVQINAISGEFVSIAIETPAGRAKETAAGAAKAKAKLK